MLQIAGTGVSDVGLVRKRNEDSAFLGPFCMLVADGVGGQAAGDVASATAAYAVATTALGRLGQDPAAALAEGFALAQEQVRSGVARDPERDGMATTLTAVATDGFRFVVAHLGDSRGYVYRRGGLTRVTNDHTYVQNLLDEGRLQPAEVDEHPWRNVVLRSVDGRTGTEPDLTELRLVAGDRILLATDGLTDLVDEDEIARTLGEADDDAAVDALVAAALARGGRDNVTCLVATVVEAPELSREGLLYGALRDPDNVVDPAAAQVRSA